MESQAPAEAEEVERAMSDVPAQPASSTSRGAMALDAIAYSLAVLSILVMGSWFGSWGLTISHYGEHEGDRWARWRPSKYGIFHSGDWEMLRFVVGVSATLAGIALAVSWRRRKTSRLAAASMRLAILGLSMVGLAVVVGIGVAIYQQLYY